MKKPMPTTVINLIGGPGSGKSTLALELTARAKRKRISVELVQEYIKTWAYQGRVPGPFDKVKLMAKQIGRESELYGLVDVIVTDSPIVLGPVYEKLYGKRGAKSTTTEAVMAVLDLAAQSGVNHRYYFLQRTVAFVPEGRFEKTEPAALKVDAAIRTFLEYQGLSYLSIDPQTACDDIMQDIIKCAS